MHTDFVIATTLVIILRRCPRAPSCIQDRVGRVANKAWGAVREMVSKGTLRTEPHLAINFFGDGSFYLLR